MSELALQLDSVCKTYQGFALRDVSFELPRGYIMGLIGANGAGKTTILKLILNLIRRESGRITVFGKDNLKHEVEVKRNIGFIHDVPRFYDDARLIDIARAVAPFYPNWEQARFDSLIGEFGLPMRKKFKKLSTGMKTLFALSIALSHDADLILMDEPTSGLDPIVRRELLDKLRDILQDERKAIVFSTHITSDLERIADYITCVHEGQIVFCSPRDEILERWGVVKADEETLRGDIRTSLHGMRQSTYGCEALTDDVEAARALTTGGSCYRESFSRRYRRAAPNGGRFMLTLIRKDLLLHKSTFYGFTPAAVVYLGWFASQIDSPNVFATFACIFAVGPAAGYPCPRGSVSRGSLCLQLAGHTASGCSR